MSYIKKHFEILVLLILSLAPLVWFKGDLVVIGHDSGFRLKFVDYLKDLFFSWNPTVGFGADLSINKGFLITQFPETLFSYLTGSLRTGEMITFVFWFFLLGASMYVFVFNFFPQRKYWSIRLISSLLYMFNFFVLQGWFIAERAKFSLMIALPLMLVIIYKVFNREWSILKAGLLFGILFFFFNGGGSPPLYGSVLLAFFVSTIFFTILNIIKNGRSEIIYSLKVVFAMAISAVLINAYWLFPQIFLALFSYSNTLSAQGGVEGIMQWEQVVSKYASIINLVRLQGVPDWYGNPAHPYAVEYINNPLLIALSFLPALLIFLGLFFYPKFEKTFKKTTILSLTLIILLFGLLFSSGSHEPFGALYILFLKFVPGFAIFRSAFYKFGPLLWFASSFLTAYFIYGLYIHFKAVALRVLFIVLLVCYFILFSHPYLTADFFAWNKPFSTRLKIPDYVNNLSDQVNLNSRKENRVLLFPPATGGVDQYSWGFWSLDLLPRLTLNSSVITNDGASSDLVTDVYRNMYKNPKESLYFLNLLNINSILLRHDVLDLGAEGDSMSIQRHASVLEEMLEDGRVSKQIEDGKWSYISISDPLKESATETIIVYAGDMDIVDSLTALNTPENVRMISDTDATNLGDLYNVATKEIISAECISCTPEDLWKVESAVSFTSPNLLPGGLLYSIVESQEKKYKETISQNPESEIDAGLSYSTLRLSELSQLFSKELQESTEENVKSNINRYQNEVNTIFSSLDKLDLEQSDKYKLRILGYLNSHAKYLKTTENRHGLAQDDLNKLLLFIEEKQTSLADELNLIPNKSVYGVTVPSDGNYNIVTVVPDGRIFEIDGREIDSEAILLTKGYHKLDVYSPIAETVMDTPVAPGEVIELDYGKDLIFDTKKIDSTEQYLVEVEIDEIEGRDPYILISEIGTKDGKDVTLRSEKRDLNKVSNSYSRVHTLHPLTEKLNISIMRGGYVYEKSKFVLSKMQVSPVENKNIYLVKDLEGDPLSSPVFSSLQIDPTLRVVSIRDAKDPYLLLYSQQYNSGWRAFILPSGSVTDLFDLIFNLLTAEKVETRRHVKVNLFENAWYIDKQGSYDVVIFYWPQMYFYIGVLVSMLSLFTAITILIRKRGKK